MSSTVAESPGATGRGPGADAHARREITLSIGGMTCASCVRRVQSALNGLSGVAAVEVDLADGSARVRYDAALVSMDGLRNAVTSAGYEVGEALPGTNASGPVAGATSVTRRALRWPIAAGIMAAMMLAGLYSAILTVVQSWDHALELFTTDWYFILAIAAGFGLQVGLFVYVRIAMRVRRQTGSTVAITGAGTGTSTVSMLACCAHHATDVMPLLGISGAAIFLADYRVPFMLLGIATNVVGVLIMLRMIRKMPSSISLFPNR